TNYELSFVGANLTITARKVTVTADAQTKVYGEADRTLTYEITEGSLVTGDAFTGALSRAAGSTLGTYGIAQGTLALSTNYDLTFVGANLTITARKVTPLTYQITEGSLVSGDNFSGALSRAPGSTLGTYGITQGTLALSMNYELSFAGANLTITARKVTVAADPQTTTYGEADPALTYEITEGSLVTGDAFTGVLSRAPGNAVGTYAITRGTLALSTNYDLTFVGANLTITARKVTVTADAQTKVYGEADPALTYQITEGSLVTGDAFSGALSRAAGSTLGTYGIAQGTLART
ncbi:MAG: MBG-2 domain-containing protein, partial [Acidobacteria bacterium]|nr:MBG-2 domain-containing protein [Acidobacteriota bacterium]